MTTKHLPILLFILLGFSTIHYSKHTVSSFPTPSVPTSNTPATYKNNIRSIYRIALQEPTGVRVLGSGIAISAHHVIIAKHMLEQSTLFLIQDVAANKQCDGAFVRCAETADIALLETTATLSNFIHLEFKPEFELGDDIYIIGCRWGLTPYDIRHGSLSYLKYVNALSDELILSSVDAKPGDSGGGVFDSKHNFIGMVSGSLGGCQPGISDNMDFVPVTRIKTFMLLHL